MIEQIDELIGEFDGLDDNDGWINAQNVGAIVARLAAIARGEHLIAAELRRQAVRHEERVQTLEVREVRLIDEILARGGNHAGV
jgi:hypothetical protein